MLSPKHLTQCLRFSFFGPIIPSTLTVRPKLGAIVTTKEGTIPPVSELIFQFPSPIAVEYVTGSSPRAHPVVPWSANPPIPPPLERLRKDVMYFAASQHLHPPRPWTVGSFQLGFGVAPTPFLTGTPYTLYCEGKAYSKEVCVGVTFDSASRINWQTALSHSLQRWGPRQRLRACQGNVIARFDSPVSPIGELMSLLTDVPGASSKNVVVGLYHGEDTKPFYMTSLAAGSPSRGTLLLNSEFNLTSDMQMQWFIHQGNHDEEEHCIPQLRVNGVFVDCPSGFSISCEKTGQVLAFRDVPVTVDILCQMDGNPILVSKETRAYP